TAPVVIPKTITISESVHRIIFMCSPNLSLIII
ncbi:MAG: hypothetical protein ACI8Q2_000558, partial [Candidatus Omnitrophota bacterium]